MAKYIEISILLVFFGVITSASPVVKQAKDESAVSADTRSKRLTLEEYERFAARGAYLEEDDRSAPQPFFTVNQQEIVLDDGPDELVDLVSIAEGAAVQANRATNRQGVAGVQAAFQASNSLAQTAAANAATAQVANAGKLAMVNSLQKQLYAAYSQIQEEASQLQRSQRAAEAAQEVAQQSVQQVGTLTVALNSAQTSANRAQEAARVAAHEADAQAAMLEQAHQRLSRISQQLSLAQERLKATQQAAQTATNAAQNAQDTANQHATNVHEASRGSGGVQGRRS